MSLKKYLYDLGLAGSDDFEAIEQASKEYKRNYWKAHKKASRKNKKHLTVILEKQTAEQLETLGQQYGYPLSSTARLVIEAYLSNAPLPSKELHEAFEKACILLRTQGNLLNQVARHVNTNKAANTDTLQAIIQILQQQEASLKQLFDDYQKSAT